MWLSIGHNTTIHSFIVIHFHFQLTTGQTVGQTIRQTNSLRSDGFVDVAGTRLGFISKNRNILTSLGTGPSSSGTTTVGYRAAGDVVDRACFQDAEPRN